MALNDLLKTEFMKIYVIPDNDEPGEKYYQEIRKHFLSRIQKENTNQTLIII